MGGYRGLRASRRSGGRSNGNQSTPHPARKLCAAILGRIELLLREGRQQQPQPFQLPGRQHAIEHLVVIGQRDQLALRDIAQIGARGQVDRRRKLGQEVVRQIEIDVEPRQVAPVLAA